MTNNLNEFIADITKFAATVPPREARLLQQKLALQALTKLVLRTPVDTGRARGNWYVSIGSPTNLVTDNQDKSGTSTINAGLAAIGGVGNYGIIWISNNVEYITVLDQGLFEPPNPGPSSDPREDRFGRVLVSGGFSVQAPEGMVAVTIAELRSQFP